MQKLNIRGSIRDAAMLNDDLSKFRWNRKKIVSKWGQLYLANTDIEVWTDWYNEMK